MATYLEIYDQLIGNANVEKRIVVACLITANDIIHEDPATAEHELRMNWARSTITNPTQAAIRMMPVLLAAMMLDPREYSDAEFLGGVQANVNAYAQVA